MRRLYRNYRWYGENDDEIEISWIQSFFDEKLTIYFHKALRRAGSFDFLTDTDFDKIITVRLVDEG
jgi:hypothetical protein